MTWIDQTSYSRNERGNAPPRVWAIEGRDPLATNERLPSELPVHHPLMDARQSARQLLLALGVRVGAPRVANEPSEKT